MWNLPKTWKDGERAAHHIFHLRGGLEEEKALHRRICTALSCWEWGWCWKLNVTHTLYLLQEIPHNSQHGRDWACSPPPLSTELSLRTLSGCTASVRADLQPVYTGSTIKPESGSLFFLPKWGSTTSQLEIQREFSPPVPVGMSLSRWWFRAPAHSSQGSILVLTELGSSSLSWDPPLTLHKHCVSGTAKPRKQGADSGCCAADGFTPPLRGSVKSAEKGSWESPAEPLQRVQSWWEQSTRDGGIILEPSLEKTVGQTKSSFSARLVC